MDIMEISVYVSVPLMDIQYMEISVSVCKCPFYAHVLRSLYLSVAPLCSYMEISVSVYDPFMPIHGDLPICKPGYMGIYCSICLSFCV